MSEEQDLDFLNNLNNLLDNINGSTEDYDVLKDISSDVQPTFALPNMNLFADEVQQLRNDKQELLERVNALQEALNRQANCEVAVNNLSQQNLILQEQLETANETIKQYRQEVEMLSEQLQAAHGVTLDTNQRLSEIAHITARNKELERRIAELQNFEGNVKIVAEVALGIPAERFTLSAFEEALSKAASAPKAKGNAPVHEYQSEAMIKQRKEEAAKIKTKCYAYLMYMRKRYEQITGWRFNMKSPVEYEFVLSALGKGNEFKYVIQPNNRFTLAPNPFLTQNIKMLEELKLKTAPDSPETNRAFYPSLMAASVLRAAGLL